MNIDSVASVESVGASATMRAELAVVDFVSMAQFRNYSSENTLEVDSSSGNGRASYAVPRLGTVGLATLSFVSTTKMPYLSTEEFQLLSTGDGPLSWIVGALSLSSREQYDPLCLQFRVTGPDVAVIESRGDTRALAGSAQASYKADDRLFFTLGG